MTTAAPVVCAFSFAYSVEALWKTASKRRLPWRLPTSRRSRMASLAPTLLLEIWWTRVQSLSLKTRVPGMTANNHRHTLTNLTLTPP